MSTNPGHVWKDLHEAQLRGNPVHGTRIKTGSLAKSPQAQYQLNQACAMHRAWTCTTFIIWNSSQQSEKYWKNKTSSKLGTFLDMEGTNMKLLCKVVFTLEKKWNPYWRCMPVKSVTIKRITKGSVSWWSQQRFAPSGTRKFWTSRARPCGERQWGIQGRRAMCHMVKWTESAQPTAIASHSKLSSFSFISPNCHSESSQFNET